MSVSLAYLISNFLAVGIEVQRAIGSILSKIDPASIV